MTHYVSGARNLLAHPRGSVRRASGLVLVGNSYLIAIMEGLSVTRRLSLDIERIGSPMKHLG